MVKVRKHGGSLVVGIPDEILKAKDISEGDECEWMLNDWEQLVLRKINK
jgi:antitoxin component of MazEF toxin-antitoxin module